MSMTNKEMLTSGTLVGIPVVDGVTESVIITAAGLEEMVFLGLTYGAWWKLAMFFSLFIVIVLNLHKVFSQVLYPFYYWVRDKIKGQNKIKDSGISCISDIETSDDQ